MRASEYVQQGILYFPHIEIRDTAWLKSALCIWDCVYRIVPSTYSPHDSDEVKEAIDAGVVKNITLSTADLQQAREGFHELMSSREYLPDALERPPRTDTMRVHREKLDDRMISELSDLVDTITREGDWFDLPRGLADGYLLFLSDAVARRRALPKLTDSDTMFATMQYFSFDGNLSDSVIPAKDEDMSAALVFRHVSPMGIDDHPLRKILKFREANAEGRDAFRAAVNELVHQISKVEDEHHARELIQSFIAKLQEAEKITLAQVKEHFTQPQSLLIYMGLPLGAKAFESLVQSSDSTLTIGSVGLMLICALTEVMKKRRDKWVPAEATYLAKLRQAFVGNSPFPAHTLRLDRMMEEFFND